MIETLKMDALLVAFGFTFYFSPYFHVLLQLENGSNYACVVLCWHLSAFGFCCFDI